jgi:hypothetical protein
MIVGQLPPTDHTNSGLVWNFTVNLGIRQHLCRIHSCQTKFLPLQSHEFHSLPADFEYQYEISETTTFDTSLDTGDLTLCGPGMRQESGRGTTSKRNTGTCYRKN